MVSGGAAAALGVVAAALAGCGEDVAGGQCGEAGRADGEAEVRGAPLGPFARAGLVRLPDNPLGTTHALVFAEAPGACGAPSEVGRSLVLALCDAPAARGYIAVAPSQFRCPGDNVLALVEEDGGVDVTTATGGTLDLARVDGCVAGAFALELGEVTLAGAFDAVVCGAAVE